MLQDKPFVNSIPSLSLWVIAWVSSVTSKSLWTKSTITRPTWTLLLCIWNLIVLHLCYVRPPCIPQCPRSSGFVPPNFLTSDQLAAIVEDLTAEEIRRGTKLTPAIQVGFEDTYYEVQIVLEITVLQEGLSIVLGIPMNSKSSTFDAYCAIPLHQPNEDGTTASVYRFSHEFMAIATDNSQYAELSATTLS